MDNINFKEFKIEELFDIKSGKQPEINNRYYVKTTGTVNTITGSTSNNGISFYSYSDFNYKNELTISKDGEYAGTVFLQTQPFILGGHVLGLFSKDKEMSNMTKLYISTLINKERLMWAGYDRPTVPINRLKNLYISLPVTNDGEPNYEYMETYIKQIILNYLKKIKTYLNTTILDQGIIKEFNNIKFKEFKLGDMFKKLPTNKLPYKTSELPSIPEENFILPALTAGIQNQGLVNYVPEKNATILKNVITISANGANTGASFFQSDNFTVLQDAYAIDLIDKPKNINKRHYLYLLTLIRARLIGQYDWSNKAGWAKLENLYIHVPVTNDGKPDYEYMEKYVQNIEFLQIHKLIAFLEQNYS